MTPRTVNFWDHADYGTPELTEYEGSTNAEKAAFMDKAVMFAEDMDRVGRLTVIHVEPDERKVSLLSVAQRLEVPA